MLSEHFRAIEAQLLATALIPANSGHTLHRGTPREAFIREFLQSHLSERVAIGTGEIIDSTSRPRAKRNQFDIVIYKRDYPKLNFGGGVSAFLAESVVATIEVKSILDKPSVEQAIRAAVNAKALKRSLVNAFSAGYQPPSILNYVISYAGPASMTTVRDWVHSTQKEQGIPYPSLPVKGDARGSVPSPSLDAIVVLGKGFWYFDNVPAGLVPDSVRQEHPELQWIYADSTTDTLLILFLFLTMAAAGVSGSWLDPLPYVTNVEFKDIHWAGPHSV